MAGRVVADRYAVLGELGRGSIGIVWRAVDRVTGQPVALKELRVPAGLSTAEREALTERVTREARAVGELSDPSIVNVYDVAQTAGAIFIVMELVEATTLTEVLHELGPLPADRVAAIGLQVLSALRTAHAAGVVHGDVKPGNMMLLPDGQVKLADFGTAAATDDPELTGSPAYRAPELFDGSPLTPASDLWSLGATLFHLSEGRAPFHSDTTAATIQAIRSTSPALERTDGPLAEVVLGLLQRAPEARMSPDRARNLLRRLISEDPPTEVFAPIAAGMIRRTDPATEVFALPWVTESRKRGRRRMVAAGACLALVLAVGGVMLAVGTAAPRSTAAPGPVRHTAGTIVLPDPTIIIGTTTTTVPTTTTTVPTTTTRTTTKASPPQAPPPQTTTAPPKLDYVPLIRYHDRSGHHVTLAMGHAAPSGFSPDAMLGYLVTTNAPGTVRFYLCRAGSGYFSSVDQSGGCEGQTTLAMQGYLFSAPPPGNSSSALYRCGSGSSSEDSLQGGCGGAQREGYVELPTRG